MLNRKLFSVPFGELFHKTRLKLFLLRLRWIRWVLPTPGNVIFTLLVLSAMLWAQSAGAISFGALSSTTSSLTTIPYQGRLTDKNGAPLTQTINMSFRLYNVGSGGASLWEEQWSGSNSVQVNNGLFNVMLGSLMAIPQAVITGNSNLFLGITVGTDNEMSPRVQLGSVPFAMQALTVPDGSITTAKIADGSVTAAKMAGGLTSSFGGRPNSYPFVTSLTYFQLQVGNFNNGYAAGDSGSVQSVAEGVSYFTRGIKLYTPSPNGRVESFINGPNNSEPRWGYAYTFFLNNPSNARNLVLPIRACNDVIISTLTGAVSADTLGSSGTQVYHRFPGAANNPNLTSCPCGSIDPSIPIPAGTFRLNFMTRGAQCMSYFNLGYYDLNSNWIMSSTLSIDWPSLRSYLGEE